MNIRRAIEIAREISDQPNVLVVRSVLLSRMNGAYDLDGEAAMLELESKVGTYAGLSYAVNSERDRTALGTKNTNTNRRGGGLF